MAKVQLIIGGEVADVYPGADIVPAVSFSISDINDIEKRTSPTTKTIKLPATPRNRRIFGFPDDPTVTSFKGQKVSTIGVVRESGTDILTGLVNLKSVQRTSKEQYFEITIIGNSAEWIETMAAASLRDLGNYGYHYKTQAAIEASYAGTLPYAYGLINEGYKGGEVRISSIEDDGNGKCLCIVDGTITDYGLRTNIAAGNTVTGLKFDNSAYNTAHVVAQISGYGDYGYGVWLNTSFMGNSTGVLRPVTPDIRVEDLSLLINAEKILTKMFNTAGYRIQSDFVSSDYFKSLFILPGAEKWTQEYCEARRVKVGTNYDYTATGTTHIVRFNTIIEGNAAWWDTINFRHTNYYGHKVRFKVQVRIKGTEGHYAYVKFPLNEFTNTDGATGVGTNVIELSPDYQTLTQEAVLRLSNADHVQIVIAVTPLPGGVYGEITLSPDDCFVECIVEPDVIKGSYIEPYQMLPDEKQINLLKGLRHLFNLFFMTDVNKKVVYIEPRDTFYLRDKTVDWSAKMDISQPVTIEELGSDLSKVLVFRYKEDGDDWGIQQDNKKTGAKYSSHAVTLDNRFSGKDEKAVENPFFAPTLMDTYDSAGLELSALPKIWQEPETGDIYATVNKEYLPRILCFAGLRDCKAGESWRFEGVTKTEFPFFYSYDADSVNDNSLLFKPQAGIPDLFSKHYANYVRTLNESRKVTCYMMLTAKDIQPIVTIDPTETLVQDFRSLFYLKNGGGVFPCRLETITDYAAGAAKPTKVSFITDSDNIFDQLTPFVSQMEFTNDTLAIGNAYANVVIVKYAPTWTGCRDAAYGSALSQSMTYGGGAFKSTSFQVERIFLFFDTSNIPNGATITEVYLDIYKIGGDYSQELTLFAGTQSNIVTSGNFSAFGSVAFGESLPGAAGLRRIVLNEAGRSSVNKSGWTKFCLRNTAFDVFNVPPPAYYQTFKTYLLNSPDTYRNKLTVKYIE